MINEDENLEQTIIHEDQILGEEEEKMNESMMMFDETILA